MALSTRTTSPAVPVAERGRVVAPVVDAARIVSSVVCAVSAGVHAGLVPAHLRESSSLGVLFVVASVLLGLAGLVVSDRGAGATPLTGAAVVLGGTALAYLLSRTTGLPRLSEPEPWDALGLFTTLSEVAGAAACLLIILRRDR
jgi:peptidoglycan/LPS O-acetylase OafA/YrhL